MKFECPDCGQHLAMETMHAGQAVKCPACGANISAPAPVSSPSAEVIKTLQSSIDRGNMTISQYMSQRKIEGVVDLAASETGSTASAVLTADQGRKYQLGAVVAQGGMGAILDAKDANLRRGVAMKVILHPDQASDDQILRFIQEAQVTSQLEHPSIVPVHELGVDASGNVFYTMKFVHGRTLKDILKKIGEDDAQTIKDYPLSHLLNIFQKVCDAMAFAHSKRVIHRDLKPENVMVGDYGEVQVMDWGLAKVLPGKKRQVISNQRSANSQGQKSPTANVAIDSVRGDDIGEVLNTMDGSIMGTPGFMSPEQALGETEKIDERTDIYALGAILYNILTLDVPVKAKNLADLINKVTTGEIRKPTEYNQRRTGETAKGRNGDASGFKSQVSSFSSLPHLPDNRVPESLSAVTMKALEIEAHRRYQTVKLLQTEIEAYQGGFATGAEQAGAWKQFTLFVKRNKGISISVVAAIAILVVVTVWFVTRVNSEKDKALSSLKAFQTEQVRRQTDRKSSAPAMVETAKTLIVNKNFDAALGALATAAEYDPDLADARLLATAVFYLKGRQGEALEHCRAYAKFNPDDSQAKRLVTMCETAVKNGPNAVSTGELADLLSRKGMPTLGAEFAKSAESKLALYRSQVDKAWPGAGVGLKMGDDGKLMLNLDGRKDVTDLRPLQGIPLTSLNIKDTPVIDLSALKGMMLAAINLSGTKVTDLTPLKGMPLTSFDVGSCKWVTDLSPLKGMSLTWIDLNGTKVTDVSPLKGMPLTWLNLRGTKVSDLSPLKGIPLTSLDFFSTLVTELSPLKGMPLTSLNLSGTKVNDLTPLKGMPLTSLSVNSTPVSDLTPLKGLPLQELSIGYTQVSDLTALKGMPLTILQLYNTQVSDLNPLKGMTLTKLLFTPKNITNGIEIIRDMKTLKEIGIGFERVKYWPTSEFWKRYDAGEFNK